MKNMMKLLIAGMALILSGCVSISKVDTGERTVGERLQLTLDGAWNQVNVPNITGPNAELWTMEGLAIDELLIYSGLRNDQPVHAESAAANQKQRSFKFRSDMQAEQIVALFEGMLTRDGSVFTLSKLEPAPFGGGKGFRFEYTLTRKRDNVELWGMGGGVVSKGDLFAVVYHAPKLVFYPRHQGRVAAILASARVKGEGQQQALKTASAASDAPAKPALGYMDSRPQATAAVRTYAVAPASVAQVPMTTSATKTDEAPVRPAVLASAAAPAPAPAPVATIAAAPAPASKAAPAPIELVPAVEKAVAPAPAVSSPANPRSSNNAVAALTEAAPIPARTVPQQQAVTVDDKVPVTIEMLPFRPGVSSATVERLGKRFGCAGTQGAGLITDKGPVEVYRMKCENGTTFLAQCELRQCRPMR